MAHESFENSAIAAVMDELFVNIKVDREDWINLATDAFRFVTESMVMATGSRISIAPTA